MKKIISSMCVLALLAGCVEQEERSTRVNSVAVTRRVDYDPAPPVVAARVRPLPEPVGITRTQEAMEQRRASMRRQEEAIAFEREAYRSAPAQPSGRVSAATPPPRPIIVPPMQPPPEAGSPDSPDSPGLPSMPMAPMPPTSSVPPSSGPPPVAEPPGGIAPVAVPVPGKPGFVVSPYSPQSGYVDVTGLAHGSEAHDPYTGQVFRVP